MKLVGFCVGGLKKVRLLSGLAGYKCFSTTAQNDKDVFKKKRVQVQIPKQDEAEGVYQKLYDDCDGVLTFVARTFKSTFTTEITYDTLYKMNLPKKDRKLSEVCTVEMTREDIIFIPKSEDDRPVVIEALTKFYLPLIPRSKEDGKIICGYPVTNTYVRERIFKDAKAFADERKKILNTIAEKCIKNFGSVEKSLAVRSQHHGVTTGIVKIYHKKIDELLQLKREELKL